MGKERPMMITWFCGTAYIDHNDSGAMGSF